MAKLQTLKSSLPILGTTGIRLLDTKAGATPRIRGSKWMKIRRSALVAGSYTCVDCGRVPGWADDVTAVGTSAKTNAEHANGAAGAANSSAVTADQRANAANQSAITAAQKADAAATSATSANTANTALQKLYLGLKSAHPTTDSFYWPKGYTQPALALGEHLTVAFMSRAGTDGWFAYPGGIH